MLLYLFCFLTAAALLAADQWTKFWVESHMALEEIRPLLPPVLELHAVHNYGAAWSLFAGARWVLVGVTGFMMLAVALALCLRLVRHPLGVFSAFLILAGGVGNLLDRIFQGYVVDMLRFPFWTSYPTFNVADICVVSGCILWLLYVLFVREDLSGAKPGKAGKPEKGAAGTEADGTGKARASKAEETDKAKKTDKVEKADKAGKADRIPVERPSGGGWEFGETADSGENAQDADSGESVWDADRMREDGVRDADRMREDSVRDADRMREDSVRGTDETKAETPAHVEEPRAEAPLPPVPPVLLSYAGRSAQAASPERADRVEKVLSEGGDAPKKNPAQSGDAPKKARAYDPAILGGSPWKALLEEEELAEAKASKGEKTAENWDSAESFFGGTPFRMSDKNGRVWP